MAHFCELDENNIVKRTIVVDDNEVGENGSSNKGGDGGVGYVVTCSPVDGAPISGPY